MNLPTAVQRYLDKAGMQGPWRLSGTERTDFYGAVGKRGNDGGMLLEHFKSSLCAGHADRFDLAAVHVFFRGDDIQMHGTKFKV